VAQLEVSSGDTCCMAWGWAPSADQTDLGSVGGSDGVETTQVGCEFPTWSSDGVGRRQSRRAPKCMVGSRPQLTGTTAAQGHFEARLDCHHGGMA
jgi:hypothetical protein